MQTTLAAMWATLLAVDIGPAWVWLLVVLVFAGMSAGLAGLGLYREWRARRVIARELDRLIAETEERAARAIAG